MDHDRQDVSTPATRCAAGIMPVAVSLSNAPPTATPSSVMGPITATNVDDFTTFGAVLEDVPPIRTPSTTLARRGTLVSRRSRRMVVAEPDLARPNWTVENRRLAVIS